MNYTGGQTNYSAVRRAKTAANQMNRQIERAEKEKREYEAAQKRAADRQAAYEDSYRKQHNWVPGGRDINQSVGNVTNAVGGVVHDLTPSSGNGVVATIVIGGFAAVVAVSVALITAPVIGAVGCAKLANGGMIGKGMKKRVAATVLAGVGAFAGTAVLQKEYMNDIHQVQVEIVNDIRGVNQEAQ